MADSGRLGDATPRRHRGFATGVRAHLEALVPSASPATTKRLADEAQPRVFRRSAVLIAAGDDQCFGVILKGWVAVRRSSRFGHRFTLAALGPGEAIGTPAGPHRATATECAGL